jgi:hypothetical protein
MNILISYHSDKGVEASVLQTWQSIVIVENRLQTYVSGIKLLKASLYYRADESHKKCTALNYTKEL